MNTLDKKISATLDALGIERYRTKSHYADSDASMNLTGRTHYVNADTLRYFKSRILRGRSTKNGFFYILQESLPHPEYSKRVRRNVVFNMFGAVISDSDLFHTSADKADKNYNELFSLYDSLTGLTEAELAISNYLTRQSRTLENAKAALCSQ